MKWVIVYVIGWAVCAGWVWPVALMVKRVDHNAHKRRKREGEE